MSLLLALLVAASPPPAERPSRPAPPPPPPVKKAPPPYCTGTYADDFAALSKAAAELEAKPEGQFTQCVRTTAVYECLSYGGDGAIKRTKQSTTAHGTSFAFKRQGAETLLLTNFHVTEWPAVTDDDHTVSGVPSGCKRISDTLRIVDNEKDSFEADDIQLSRVVTDPVLDMAVVKAKAPLTVMPWKVGRSAALRDRNVVEVRGFPLGAFKATVEGRVTSTYDHDDYKDWDHDDFVVDAQLSKGNSGSPVLAVNCATGEYELVGVFHADYARGNSLNVVVHIDQVRELMTTLKRTTVSHPDQTVINSQSRKRLMEDTAELGQLFVPFGPLAVELRQREDGALVYSFFGKDFPTSSWPIAVIEDLDDSMAGSFGHPGRAWFGNARGLKLLDLTRAEESELLTVEKTIDTIRRMALLASTYRHSTARASASREATQDVDRLEKEMRRLTAQARDMAQALLELSDKHAPVASDIPVPPSRPFMHPSEAEPPPLLSSDRPTP